MIAIFDMLTQLEFSLNEYSKDYFIGDYTSENNFKIEIFCQEKIISASVCFKGLQRPLFCNMKVENSKEVLFLLSSNNYIKTEFKLLYKEIIEFKKVLNI